MAIDVLEHIDAYGDKMTKAASLAVFRILFGTVLFVSMIRFWYKGWIEEVYLLPELHFHYSYFDFIQVPGVFTYALFAVAAISALGIAFGFKYRFSVFLFFLSFVYIELMDKTSYLNHYYFVSVVTFILFFLPANCNYSIDAWRNPSMQSEFVPAWTVDVLKLMLAIVYIYAGIAKLNADWMLNAMPLAIWLPTKTDLPIIGAFVNEEWLHYLFSWGGALYDLGIVFFLLWGRTRPLAFMAVLIFHLLTALMFPIGMFPYIMICMSLIFFSSEWHERALNGLMGLVGKGEANFENGKLLTLTPFNRIGKNILIVFMIFQLLFPLRSLLMSENVFWTEQGYRFSWRVMLMEKTGYANFKIVDAESGRRFYVQNQDFLTPRQEKQMSTQPDFILEYARFLGDHFESQGHKNVAVYVDSFVALNGRKSQQYINPNVNLRELQYSDLCKKHIIPLGV